MHKSSVKLITQTHKDYNSDNEINNHNPQARVEKMVAFVAELQDYSKSDQQQQSQGQVDTHDIMYLIQQLSRTYNLHYSQQLGCICAHVSKHYKNITLTKPERDLVVAHQLVNKFKLIFTNKHENSNHQNSFFSCFEDLVKYGVNCVLNSLSQGLSEQLKKEKKHIERVVEIVSRLLRSLFLEFIPASYSAVMIEIYLSESQGDKETNQINNESSTESFNIIMPYKCIFQLFLSLTYHICFNKNIVNLAHFFELLERPYMGVVEWPMVIGARNHFDLPSPQQ